MPGLCGILSKRGGREYELLLQRMLDSLVHEKSYARGKYVNAEVGLFAGWACHGGSFSDCMPIRNEKQDVVVLFYGETFQDKELFDELKRKNHAFSHSGASYLVHLYEERGDDFLNALNGWFSGVIVDTKRLTVTLFNDRFGMQRLYYYEGPDAFYFSSEAKAILKVVPEARQLDLQSLGEVACCDCPLEQRTLFRNVKLLPAASRWVFAQAEKQKEEQYFDVRSWEEQTVLGEEAFYEKLRSTVQRVLPRYFRSDQNIGLSLTGGLDTRIIMAYLDPGTGKYPCYTFGGMYRESFDVKIARRVAKVCGQNHQVIELGKAFLKNFPQLAERTVYISDGGLDVSGAPDLYINKIAREIAPIRVTGNYGSEVLRGVRFLKSSLPQVGLYSDDFSPYLKQALKTYRDVSQGNALSFTLLKDLPWHEYSRLAVEQSQLTARSPYLDIDLVGLMYRALPEYRMSKKMSLRLVKDGNRALSEFMTDRGVGGRSSYLARELGRMYYEFLFKSEYLYNYGMPQWLAMIDHTLQFLHLERLFLGRHKFHHCRIWFRDELAKYVREILLDERTLSRPYLNRKFILHMIDTHTAGTRNYTTEITKVLSMELTQRLLVEQA